MLGATSAQEDKQQIDNAVRQLYMRDFIANWDRFLADIQLNNSADLSQRINTARLLSAGKLAAAPSGAEPEPGPDAFT